MKKIVCFLSFLLTVLSIATYATTASTAPTAPTTPTTPLQCIVTVTKPTAWANFDVQIQMNDYINKKEIVSFDLSSAKNGTAAVFSATKTFDCKKYTEVQFTASYTPIIWSTDKGRIYNSNRIWDVSEQVAIALKKVQQSGTTATVKLSINFPDDFEGVSPLIEGVNN